MLKGVFVTAAMTIKKDSDATEILVENMELLNPKPMEREENALQNAAQPTTAQPISSQQATEKQNTSPVDDTTDDNKTLPF